MQARVVRQSVSVTPYVPPSRGGGVFAANRRRFAATWATWYIVQVRVLGLDVGSKTIGMALSDSHGQLATAWTVWSRRGNTADAQEIAARVVAQEIGCIVVGLPLELDGRMGHRARLVERFVEVLGAATDVPITWWDERFSTAAAERTLLEADVSRAKRKQKIDAVAAQFILQGWLDRQADAAAESDPDEV